MMKYFFLLALSLKVFSSSGQGVSWAQSIIADSGHFAQTGIYTASTDASGHLYTVGWLSGTVDFDAGPGNYIVTSVSTRDMFIMKEDPSGTLVWVKLISGRTGIYGVCSASNAEIDQRGNLLVFGYVEDKFDFDPGPGLQTIGDQNRGALSYILKLDSAGNFVWLRSLGKQQNLYPVDTRVTAARQDKYGNLYLAAWFYASNSSGPIDVDPGPDTTLMTFHNSDMLLEKLDSSGKLIWADQLTSGVGAYCVSPTSLSVDDTSNVFLSGVFLSGNTYDFDPGSGLHLLTSAGTFFVSRFDSAGHFSWVNEFGYYAGTTSRSVKSAVDQFGNILVTGDFEGTANFDPRPGMYKVSPVGIKDFFVLKLRNNGAFAWVRTGGTPSATCYGGYITTDASGNVYTAIGMSDTCDLVPGGNYYAVPAGVAVQELDSSGNFRWGAGWQGEVPNWIGLDRHDSIYVCGTFSGTNKDFDPGPAVYPLSGNPIGQISAYVIKLKQMQLTLGTAHPTKPSLLIVWPNPSAGTVSFSSSSLIHRIVITDMTGKLVYMAEPYKAEAVIDLGIRATGAYFYTVDCEAGKQRGKLVIF